MTNITRRNFLKLSAVSGVSVSAMGFPFISRGATGGKVVVVGGGAGGTIAAKYLRMMDESIEVTLIEQNDHYTSCFLSNEVLNGERQIESLTFSYDGLSKHGIKVVKAKATAIDPAAKKVVTDGGEFTYDRLIVSPGVEMDWGAIAGYDEAASETMLHAWKAGPQTIALRKQLEEMPDGGKVIICAPANPFRCPPGPYERASLIADYFKKNKPKSKVMILDAKDDFAKKGLFEKGWTKLYGYGTENSMIEWVPAAKQGKVMRVDAAKKAVYAGELEDEHAGDVVNVIPPQKAGKIAQDAGLTNEKGWCPVDQRTFESAKHPGIYVIGDSCVAGAMPKSAYAANSQGKVTAVAVVAALQGKEMVEPAYTNTCYSIVGENFGISVAAVYRFDPEKKEIAPVKDSGGVSPADASDEDRKREVVFAHSWFKNIASDMFD